MPRYDKSLKDALPEMIEGARLVARGPLVGMSLAKPEERSKAGFMADALAAGQMQTEAGTEALMNNQMVFLGDEEFEQDGDRIVPFDPAAEYERLKAEKAVVYAYIETLEQAVVKSWHHTLGDYDDWCTACDTHWPPLGSLPVHEADCIVPALIAKHEEH